MTMASISIPAALEASHRPAMSNYGTITARSESTDTVTTIAVSSSEDFDDDAKSLLLPRRTKRTRRFAAGLRRAGPAFRRLNPSMTLVNSGSVARDHLASERTFLAYVRTSLGISSMGVALVQLLKMAPATAETKDLKRFSRLMGGILVLTGLVTLVLGFVRYFAIQHALLKGKFPVARVAVCLLAFVLAINVVIIFSIFIGVRGATQ